MTKSQILESAKSLPADDRVELAMELWDSVRGVDSPLTEDARRELDRRVAADEADLSLAEDWETLRARLLRGEV